MGRFANRQLLASSVAHVKQVKTSRYLLLRHYGVLHCHRIYFAPEQPQRHINLVARHIPRHVGDCGLYGLVLLFKMVCHFSLFCILKATHLPNV